MKYIKKILFLTVFVAIAYACSTKKDTIVSRNYHAITTKFNILFNGNEAFKKGIEELNQGYKDNWFEQLPIEPLVFDEDKFVLPVYKKKNNSPGSGFGEVLARVVRDEKEEEKEEKPSGPFEIAEEKAAKAIQKHSMNINGLERNRQIDNAYLLLGKSRYYSQRFIPAIEAFNYVIANYPDADLIAETKIWRAKSNIRMDNEEFAIETMNLLLFVKDTLEVALPDEVRELGHTALAMAYVKADSLQKAKKHLKLATQTQKNREQAARNMFILGQMYANENKKDSAAMAFSNIISFKKAPYKYKIQANIELAKNAYNDSLKTVSIKKLQKLIENRDNRPYLDQLFYQLAGIYEQQDSLSLAIDNYNKSLRAKKGSDLQKVYTFDNLGNLYFKNSAYVLASSYYDSLMMVSSDTLNLKYRRAKRKFKNLASLINFEEVVATNDSIIKIALMPKKAQETYFTNYIDSLKKKDEALAQMRLNQIAFAVNNNNSLQGNSRGQWYFYNTKSLNFGKTDFQKNWGNRKLEDNWRWSSQATINIKEKDSTQVAVKNLRYNLASYLESIPTEKEKIDTLKIDRNQALYELGLIYKEQFKDTKLALQRLKRVASLHPRKELILPINWHLYQIYKDLESKDKAQVHKNIILTDYPNTVFAKIIKNPSKKIEEGKEISALQKTYKEMYYLYKEDKFEKVVKEIDGILEVLENAKLKPKFELLRAYAIGKHLDKETYEKELEALAIKYPTTEEGKKAKEILNQLNK